MSPLVIIMVENRTDQQDCPSFPLAPPPPRHKFSHMVILGVSELNQGSGLETMKFSSSAGVEKIRLLAPNNTSRSAQPQKRASGKLVSHILTYPQEKLLSVAGGRSHLT